MHMADRDSDWENSGEAACGWVQWGVLVGEDRSLCEKWQEKWEENATKSRKDSRSQLANLDLVYPRIYHLFVSH